jgi:hypothetical protein
MTDCEICGGPLLVDWHSVIQLARAGFEGGRIYCRCGCTDVWLKRPILRPVPSALEDGRGRYTREARPYRCEGCGKLGESRGNNARWCSLCKVAVRMSRERERYAAARAMS